MEGKHIDSVDQYCVLGKGENMVLQWKGKDALLPLQKRKWNQEANHIPYLPLLKDTPY